MYAMQSRLVCHCIGCDQTIESAVQQLVQRWGFEFAFHADVGEFQDAGDLSKTGCVVVGSGHEGELMSALESVASPLMVVVLTKHPDTRMTVSAIRRGASEVLEWPTESSHLPAALEQACAGSLQKQQRMAEAAAAQKRLAQLTDGERDVLQLMLNGKVNKNIASRLGIALRTVEARRKRVFTKLGTRSLGEIAAVMQTSGLLVASTLVSLN